MENILLKSDEEAAIHQKLNGMKAYRNFLQTRKDFLTRERLEPSEHQNGQEATTNNEKTVQIHCRNLLSDIECQLSMYEEKEISAKEIITQYCNVLISLSDNGLLLPGDQMSPSEYLELSKLIDEEGNTCLLLAAAEGNEPVVDFLIRWGADVHHSNRDGKKAIDLAWDRMILSTDRYCESILTLLKKDSKFPEKFDVELCHKNEELNDFVNRREKLHRLIREDSVEEVNEFLRGLENSELSRLYFNTVNQSALLSAINAKSYLTYAFLKSKGANLFNYDEEDSIVGLNQIEKAKLDRALETYFHKPDSGHIYSLLSKSRALQNDVNYFERIKSWYEKLNLIEEISIILQIIEHAKLDEIIFDFGKNSIVEVEHGGRYDAGIVDYKKRRIYIAAMVEERELLGTLAHELTHMAVQTIYENDCKPYNQKDEEEFNEITTKIEEAAKKGNNEMDEIISRVFTAYSQRKKQWNAELIARVPHMLAKYAEYPSQNKCNDNSGRQLLKKQVPLLLSYYDGKVNGYFKSCLPKLKKQSEVTILNGTFGIVRQIQLSGIQYKNLVDLNHFLDHGERILLIRQKSVWLSCINVYHALEKLPFDSPYHKNYILCKESTFADREAELLNSKSDLFVVICENNEQIVLDNEVLQKLDLNGKKIILIVQQNAQWIHTFKSEYQNQYDEVEGVFDISFDNLDEKSKEDCLNKQVTFQGREGVLLMLLIEKEKAKDIIDVVSLDKLIRGEKIKVGSYLTDISYLPSAYHIVATEIEIEHLRANILQQSSTANEILIPDRHIDDEQQSSSEDDICMPGGLLDELSFSEDDISGAVEDSSLKGASNDLFVFSGIKRADELAKILEIPEDRIRLFKRHNSGKDDPQIILISHENSDRYVEDFEMICHEYPKRCAHLIEVDFRYGIFTWNRYYDPNFYIERKIYHVIVKEDSLKKCINKRETRSKADIFAVSGIDMTSSWTELLHFTSLASEEEDFSTDENCLKKNHLILIKGEEEFNELCNNDMLKQHYNIHWLQCKIYKNDNNRKIVWIRSEGTAKHILDLEDRSSKLTTSEENFIAITNTEKAIVIAGEPGMGKSTILAHLLGNAKEFELVIKINLIDLRGQLNRLSNINDLITDFFPKFGLGIDEGLERKILEHRINDQGQITLFFDGFDEISGKNQENVIEVLKLLANTKAKIFVTTRLHEKYRLEGKLSVLSYTLQPFSKDDQTKLLEIFWKASLKLTGRFDGKKIDQAVDRGLEDLFNPFHEQIMDSYELMSTPLLTRMFAEIHQETVRSFFNCENQAEIDMIKVKLKRLSIIDLYGRFIEIKYDIYIKEKTRINSCPNYIRNALTKTLNKDHQSLAVSKLFSQSELVGEKKLPSQDQEKDLKLVGIIESIHGDSGIRFIHKTFAEYFSADFFVHMTLKKAENHPKYHTIRDFLRDNIFREGNEVVRYFFDCMLARNENEYELHRAILNNDKRKVDSLREQDENIFNAQDKGGRTPLHLAAAYGHDEIVKALLNKQVEVNCNDLLFGWSPLTYAAQKANWGVCATLLGMEANMDDIQKVRNVNSVDCYGVTLLHFVSSHGANIETVKSLIERGANVFATDKEGNTPLHFAAKSGFTHLINILLREEQNITFISQTNKKHIRKKFQLGKPVIGSEQFNKYRISNLKETLNGKNFSGYTPLHLAAESGKCGVVEALLGNPGIHVNAENVEKNTPLHSAARNGHCDVVEALLAKPGIHVNAENDEKNTPLHYASAKGHCEVVEALLAKEGINVNLYNGEKCTPLHIAAERGYQGVVEALLKKKDILVNVKDFYRNTPLHLAVKHGGDSNIVEFLLRKPKIRVDKINDDNDTPLDLAVALNRYEAIKLLVNKNAEITSRNILNNMDLLQWAIADGSYCTVKLILDRSSVSVYSEFEFRGLDIQHYSFLSLAVRYGRIEIFKYFIAREDIDINAYQEKWGSRFKLLHYAAFYGHKEIAKYLIDEKNADPTTLDGDDYTPLHRAANSDGIKHSTVSVAEFLIEKGTDCNVRANFGETPLHVASKSGNVGIVQLLLNYNADSCIRNWDKQSPLDLAKAKLLYSVEDDRHPSNFYGPVQPTILKKNEYQQIIDLLGNRMDDLYKEYMIVRQEIEFSMNSC